MPENRLFTRVEWEIVKSKCYITWVILAIIWGIVSIYHDYSTNEINQRAVDYNKALAELKKDKC